jgi:hypothetical protein
VRALGAAWSDLADVPVLVDKLSWSRSPGNGQFGRSAVVVVVIAAFVERGLAVRGSAWHDSKYGRTAFSRSVLQSDCNERVLLRGAITTT